MLHQHGWHYCKNKRKILVGTKEKYMSRHGIAVLSYPFQGTLQGNILDLFFFIAKDQWPEDERK